MSSTFYFNGIFVFNIRSFVGTPLYFENFYGIFYGNFDLLNFHGSAILVSVLLWDGCLSSQYIDCYMNNVMLWHSQRVSASFIGPMILWGTLLYAMFLSGRLQ